MPTRWNDNDAFGYVNNAVYYFYIDTAVNTHLLAHGITRPRFVAQSSCRYLQPLSYPQDIEVGLSVAKLGRSSVTYEIGIFSWPAAGVTLGTTSAASEGRELCATAEFVHVYVDAHGRPTMLEASVRELLTTLVRPMPAR